MVLNVFRMKSDGSAMIASHADAKAFIAQCKAPYTVYLSNGRYIEIYGGRFARIYKQIDAWVEFEELSVADVEAVKLVYSYRKNINERFR